MNTLFQTVTSKCKSRRRASDNVLALANSNQKVTQKIFIEELELEMSIGVLDSEKKNKQRVIISAELTIIPNKDWQNDEITDVVSYADVIQTIEDTTSQEHINLVETVAERILEECMSTRNVLAMTVKVQKPDIFDNARSVGTEITRIKDI